MITALFQRFTKERTSRSSHQLIKTFFPISMRAVEKIPLFIRLWNSAHVPTQKQRLRHQNCIIRLKSIRDYWEFRELNKNFDEIQFFVTTSRVASLPSTKPKTISQPSRFSNASWWTSFSTTRVLLPIQLFHRQLLVNYQYSKCIENYNGIMKT